MFRAKAHFMNSFVADSVWVEAQIDAVFEWLESHDLKMLVIPYPPVGSTQDAVFVLVKDLRQRGIDVVFSARLWDIDSWPYAGKGFFALKNQIPHILNLQGVKHEI